MTDTEREAEIDRVIRAYIAAAKAANRTAALELWQRAAGLIAGRSPERVSAMERERGLA